MDFTIGEVYQVVLSTDLDGVLLAYPITLTGKCLTTSSKYVTMLDPHNNLVKGFKKSQLSNVLSCNVDPIKAEKPKPSGPSGPPGPPKPSGPPGPPEQSPSPPSKKTTFNLFRSNEPKPPSTVKASDIVKLLEEHIKNPATKFSTKLTDSLNEFYGKQKICDLQGGIVPLDGKNCIKFTNGMTIDQLKQKIKKEYSSSLPTRYTYLLSTTSFLKPDSIPKNPVFIVTLSTKDKTYKI